MYTLMCYQVGTHLIFRDLSTDFVKSLLNYRNFSGES